MIKIGRRRGGERGESNSFYASLEADQTAFLDSYSPPTAFDEMILQNKSMESKGTLTAWSR